MKKLGRKSVVSRHAVKRGRKTPLKRAARTAEPNTFPIVGVGASAGGLEAFTRLLQNLPADTGMAFVLMQHLDPVHHSALPELLSKATEMHVCEIKNNMRVSPDRVHVIPPNARLTISNGVLKLSPRQAALGAQHSIDYFFESLAADQNERAIAVILSGTASDGTLGMEAIKAEGGITFAQDDSAKYDSMPHSAIAAGCVDFVLSPEVMARELARIAQHPYVRGQHASESARDNGRKYSSRLPKDDGAESPHNSGVLTLCGPEAGTNGGMKKDGEWYKKILLLLRNHSDVDLTLYKPNTIQRRITRRMVLNRQHTLESYCNFLRGNTKELDALYADVLIHVTSFFRNPEAFTVLKRKVFPRLLTAHRENPIRVWVMGCSTGQEAYSIAMTYSEITENRPGAPKLQIFATDLNEAVLEKARAGLYAKNIDLEITPDRLRRFFVEEDGGYRVSKALREQCIFARQNLVRDPPFSRMDLICCRNLMIYLEPSVQTKIIPTFHYALNPTGYLFLGASESVGDFTDLFDVVDKKQRIFSKRPGMVVSSKQQLTSRDPEASSKRRPVIAERPQDRFPQELNAQREADRVAISQYAPPSVLINDELQVLQFRGQTGAFLEPATGKANFDVVRMAREGLALALRTAIGKARRDQQRVRTTGVRIESHGQTRVITLEVIPLKNLKERCYLIAFESEHPQTRKSAATALEPEKSGGGDKQHVKRIGQLTKDLAETRDYLQAMQEQNEVAHEELQASNEEVTSANEELQSMNEELQTSKEELESTNEELITVNEELTHRNTELTRFNNDLNNFHASVSMAIVRVSRNLTIQHFTPQAARLFNLIAADVDRPLCGIKHNLNLPDLETLLTEVINTVSVREREVQDKDGRWYSLRARPYVTIDNKIDGAILVLIDVDELKRLELSTQRSREYAEAIIETAPPFLVLDQDLRVITANRSFCQKFNVSPEDTKGRLVYDLGNGQWNFPKLRELFDLILVKKEFFYDFEVEHDFESIGHCTMLLSARRVENEAQQLVLLSIIDISDRKRAENALRESERFLIDANRTKDEFLATLAHELRNPLAPIRNSLEIMQHAAGNATLLEEARHRIQRQMNKMVQLIDDLMDISRITRGKVTLRRQRVPLKGVIEDVLESVRAAPENADREIFVSNSQKPLYVNGDPLRLGQIVGNLVNNACKYSNAGGKISISTVREGDNAVIRVKDTGIGIDKEMLPRVFDIFTQIDHSLERARGGLGLGLAIVRSLVELHEGSVAVYSEGLGKGSEFVVRLPIAEEVTADPENVEPEQGDLILKPAGPVSKLKILVADDNMDSAESLSVLLQLDAHEVQIAYDGLAAIEMAKEFRPDVMLLDIGMPRLNGYDAAREIRKQEWGRDLTLIALTGWGQEHDKRHARDAGFNHHLVKPADIEMLRSLIATVAPAAVET